MGADEPPFFFRETLKIESSRLAIEGKAKFTKVNELFTD